MTFITNGQGHTSLMGSPEKRVDTDPSGALWVLVGASETAKFFRSTNAGATWTYVSNSDLLMVPGSQTRTYPSFFIDKQGYAHMSWKHYNASPQALWYARGTPRSGGGWSWKTLKITPQIGPLTADSDVIVFKQGTGWVAWVSYGGNNAAKVARIDISSSGALTLGAAVHGPPEVPRSRLTSIEFNHTGDGKTPSSSPHLYLTAGMHKEAQPLRAWQAVYSSGAWTWGTPVVLDTSTNLNRTVMVSVWDGGRLCVAYEAGLSLRFAQWTPGSTPTRLDPPALPTSVTTAVLAVSMAHDPATGDLYLVFYGSPSTGDADTYMSKLTRATDTWSAWTKVADRTNADRDGKVQLVRHAPKDTIDMVWATPGSGTDVFKISHTQVQSLLRTPDVPALVAPPNGALRDLAAGATFEWDYALTGASDQQQAWAFRRRVPFGTSEYWNNGSRAWQTTEVFNADTAEAVSFAPDEWINGASWLWTVRTRSSSGMSSAYASERTVVATTAPIVEVAAPLGLIFADSTPLVEWVYTSASPQRDYEVRMVENIGTVDPDTSPLVWGSGVVSSSTARVIRVGQALENGKSYVAFVRATSTNGLTSAWDSSVFSLTLDPPSGPLVSLIPEWSYPREVPRIRLRIAARSNHMSRSQGAILEGWENDFNAGIVYVQADAALEREDGAQITATVTGAVRVRTILGSPPVAPEGEAQPLGPLSFPVIGGNTYTALAHVRTETSSRAARALIRWYDNDTGTDGNAAGAAPSTSTGEQIVTSTTAYLPAVVTATAPDGARRATVVIEVLDVPAGEVSLLSRASFHPGRDTAWQPGGFSGTQTVRVERSIDGGLMWQQVTFGLGVNTYQQATADDRLMPLGVDVKYRAFTEVQGTNGAVLASAASVVGTLRIDSDLWVIRDPGDPTGEVNALVVDHTRSDTDAATVFRPAGREFPIVDSEGAQGATGSLSVYAPGDIAAATVELVRRGVPLLVQSPLGARYLIYIPSRDYTPGVSGARTIDLSYVEVG